MLDRIFPRQIDNNFRGHWLALWLLVPIVAVRLLQGMNSIVNTRFVATSADGIPLDHFNAAGADAVVSLFALLGLNVLVLPVLAVVALIRYRAMIPLVYLLMLALMIGGRVVSHLRPIATSGAMPAGVPYTLIILAAVAIGFVLSLVRTSKSPD